MDVAKPHTKWRLLRRIRLRTPVAQTVYITQTGEKYHQADCRFLAKSAIPLALDQAARRYGACKICQPPMPGQPSEAAPVTSATVAPASPRTPPSSSATRQQCAATTKKGTRWLTTAAAGSAYCWQRGG